MSRFGLYNRYLDAFLVCVKTASFTKAAQLLYISPTALIKQIKQLEDGIGYKLFDRTPRGLVCTPAGRHLQDQAQALVSFSERILEDVRRYGAIDKSEINVGTSLIFSGHFVIDLWYQHQSLLQGTRVRLVPYDNTRFRADEVLHALGEEIDVLAGVFDERFCEQYHCRGKVLKKVPICCCLPINHPLAKERVIAVEQLKDYEIFAPRYGMLADFDRAHSEIIACCPKVKLTEFDFLDFEIFNQAEHNSGVILNIEYWSSVHPLFKTVPLDWPLTANFGLIFAKEPSISVKKFLNVIDV